MRLRMNLPVTALTLASAFVVLPVSAQTAPGRAMNDGGFAPASQTGVAQYSGSGQVVGTGNNEISGSCAQRFHSYDPSTGTYLGLDGTRHPCQ
jgi:BA14K-like protein